ncbi:MAG: DUF2520 domain-containing protein [Actinobacteria bacterium]|nr:DUF2520 domain-containing protein [Actinomycetota bacterium]
MDRIKEEKINKKNNARTPARICIIGAGRVGTTIAVVIAGLGNPLLKICSISSPSKKSRDRAASLIQTVSSVNIKREILFTADNAECAAAGDIIMICTPDDAIIKVSTELACSNKFNAQQKLFIHFSGAKSLKVLLPLKEAGGYLASLHPLKSFASIQDSIKTLKGSMFGATIDRDISQKYKTFIKKLVKALGCSIIEVDDEIKTIYHASACIASNYLVSLLNYAVKTNEKIGIKPEDSLKGLEGLIDGTIANIKALGTKKSLTGPIARGDTGTIRQHLESFKKIFTGGQDTVYRIMGLETAKLAHENGWIDKNTFNEFKKMFLAGCTSK